MKEQKLAENMIFSCELSFNSFNPNYKGAVIDYKDYFIKDDYNLSTFVIECDKLGYEVVPLEKTPYALMPLKGKLVVQKKGCY